VIQAELVIEVTPLASTTELMPSNSSTKRIEMWGSWDGVGLQGGETRPSLDVDDTERRYLLGVVGTGAVAIELEGEDGPLDYGDWDARTVFSQSAAVKAANEVAPAAGLLVSTARLPEDVTIYPTVAAGDEWAFVAGELEADVGKWPGRSEA
jgi:hypothetical protein